MHQHGGQHQHEPDAGGDSQRGQPERQRDRVEGHELDRGHRLSDVECQAIEGLLDSEAQAQGLEHRGLMPRHQADQSGRHGHGQQRELLQPDPPVLRLQPLPGILGQPAQWIEVQQQQSDGEGDAVDLGEHGGREERGAACKPAPPPCLVGAGPQVAEDGQQIEHAGLQVVLATQPGHGLHAQGVQSEEERGKGRGDHGRAGVVGRRGKAQQARGHEVEEDGIEHVQREAGGVIAEGMHAPERVTEAGEEPAQGLVVAHVQGGEHPAQVPPVKAAEMGIVEEVGLVVPRDEIGTQRGPERGQNGQWDQHQEQTLDGGIRRVIGLHASRISI